MKRSLPLLVIFAALATSLPAQTLSDSEKVAIVFPFKVGQVYQFMAGDSVAYGFNPKWTFPPPSRLPANTVATITITDTVVDGKRYLHIPFWSLTSPYLAQHYRLDDSLRIWAGFPRPPSGTYWGERLVMNLNDQWEGEKGRDGDFCPEDFRMYDPFPVCWCEPHNFGEGIRLWGWTTRAGRPVLRMMCFPNWDDQYPSRWVGEQYFGAYGPGSVLHAAGWTSAEFSLDGYTFGGNLGLFRPKSDDPWPEFVTYRKATSGATGWVTGVVKDDRRRPKPKSVSLTSHPNPFNASVTLVYAVPVGGAVTLRIYNLNGQLVRTVVKRHLTAGRYTVIWNGADDVGRQVASGPYLARLVTADHSTTTRITLIR